MFGKRFYKNSDLIFGQMLLNESEEMLFNLVAILILYFKKREVFNVVFLEIIDDRLLAVE